MKKSDKSIWLIILMGVIFVGSIVFLFFYLKPDPVAEDVAKKNQIKIVFTVNNGYELLFTNLFCYDTETKQSAIFDLPPKTGIWDGHLARYLHLSHYYDPNNLEDFLKRVNLFSGDDYLYYINLSIDQVATLIDIIRGIEVFLIDPVTIELEGEMRLLPGGSFTMHGYQALLYLRDMLPGETPVEFIKRKQSILESILVEMSTINKNYSNSLLEKQFLSLFDSNFDKQSIGTLLTVLSEYDPDLMQVQQLRGETKIVNGISYFLSQQEGRLFKEQLRQISKALKDSSFVKLELMTLNLQVLNGTKRNLMAARTTEHYQSYGYNIVATGNFSGKTIGKTVIYYRLPEFERAAIRIGEIIKCSEVVLADEGLFSDWNGSDVVIILGSDYELFACR